MCGAQGHSQALVAPWCTAHSPASTFPAGSVSSRDTKQHPGGQIQTGRRALGGIGSQPFLFELPEPMSCILELKELHSRLLWPRSQDQWSAENLHLHVSCACACVCLSPAPSLLVSSPGLRQGRVGTESQGLGATGPARFLGQLGEGCPPRTTRDAWKLAREASANLGRLVKSTEGP